MDLLPAAGIALAAGYLLGSIPFSWIAVKVRTGQDLRTVGSGNAGATNAARVLGRGWFVPLFLLDAGKGAGAAALAPLLVGGPWIPVSAATGAILGHILCPWLGFRGGKAVATGAGALAVLSPLSALGGLLGFGLAAGIGRFVSLGSVVAALAVVATQSLATEDGTPVRVFAVLLAVVVVLKHIPNLRRIAAGTEPRIGERK
jgi:glycerol-3-phosphate acyltransferase PlsY